MNDLFDKKLPERVLHWVVDTLDPTAEVLSVQRLYGGISSIIHRISLQVKGGEREVVLRQFDNPEWLREEPDLAIHEAESLRFAAGTGLPTPQLIASDDDGEQCGVPAVLMTRLEGTVVLNPQDKQGWLNGLAQALVRIHERKADNFPWSYFSYNDIHTLQTPEWVKHPQVWKTVIEYVKQPFPPFKECFIHRDYHPTNVLWTDHTVSGVVDWVNACRGPAGIDIGHCRVNLAQLFDVATADAFLTAYQSYAGQSFRYDPYWDVLSLTDILFGKPQVYAGWTALGVTGLTDDLIAERLEEYATSLVNRIS
ncbi:aminoglycoside phosphotransferase family protein [Brevibacillus choshinensis]|uniref:phosphotransferase family protein n=1 Tax=Brevibacillus choshinensis TaxID=54911 RepID=UPI002E234DA4|nr:aminoglycoside phosphotransferase family protein [Brevibacillus choshinensis]